MQQRWLFALGMFVILAGLCAGLCRAERVGWLDADGNPHVQDLSELPRTPKGDFGKYTVSKAGGITFNITFLDQVNHTGIGFDDPTAGATRRATAQAVLAYMNTVLSETGTCDIVCTRSQTDGTGNLGFAGTYFSSNDPKFSPGFAFQHIHNHIDQNPSGEEIFCTMDFGHVWNSTLNPPTSGQNDLFSTLLHEFTHGLGFTSLTNSNGVGLTIDFPSPTPDVILYSILDSFLYTGTGTKIWDASGNLQVPTNTFTGGQSGIRCRGPLATARLGHFPPMYVPGTFFKGTSVTHWDDAIVSPDSAVMEHVITTGSSRRTYQSFELGMLQDLGYRLNTNAAAHWNLMQ